MSPSSVRVISSRRIHPKARVDTCELPDGRIIEPVILEFSDWVCIVAITKAQEILLIRLYRHGAGQVIWEIPGGMIDPGESPLQAASRELLEETGYAGGTTTDLGSVSPNSDNHTNRMHIFLAEGVEKIAEQHPEDVEHIEVHPTPLDRVIRMVQAGDLPQAMHISALFLALVHLERIH